MDTITDVERQIMECRCVIQSSEKKLRGLLETLSRIKDGNPSIDAAGTQPVRVNKIRQRPRLSIRIPPNPLDCKVRKRQRPPLPQKNKKILSPPKLRRKTLGNPFGPPVVLPQVFS